jgi:DNA (cytosine-5)-methyltransferase 1
VNAVMKYLSVCSGIEAATMGWHPHGFEPVAFSEIEPFPCAVLQHRYPDVPNWGDMTKFKEWPDAKVDVLVGGTPCQSFSVAGLRKGLADPRGNLMLTFLAIAAKYRPTWVVWENVPGVLSSNKGRDFGTFLAALGDCGYGWAYRILDAQYIRTPRFPHAVPQRRRRVFVVGYLGDWRRAAAVLFDAEGLQGHPAPRRETGQAVAGSLAARSNRSCGPEDAAQGHLNPTVGHALRAKKGLSHREDQDTLVLQWPAEVAATFGTLTRRAMNALGARDIEEGAVIPVGFNAREDPEVTGDRSEPLSASSPQSQAVAFKPSHFTRGKDGAPSSVVPPLSADADRGDQEAVVLEPRAVRRLTPVECERLQGFPDGFTQIPYRGRPASDCPVGPRYAALGNSWAVNCADFLGERIAWVEKNFPTNS